MKLLWRIFLSFLALCFVLVAIFLAWVITDTREVPQLARYIEWRFNDEGAKYQVKIGKSFIGWDKNTETVALQIESLDILNNDGDSITHFPAAFLDFDPSNLKNGRLLSALSLPSPEFTVNTAQGTIAKKGEKRAQKLNELVPTLISWLNEKNAPIGLSHIIIKDAKLALENGAFMTEWKLPHIELQFDKKDYKQHLNLKLLIEQNQELSLTHFILTAADKNTLDLKANLENFDSRLIYNLFPTKNWSNRFSGTINAHFNALLTGALELPQISFNLQETQGSLSLIELFPDSLYFENFSAKGHIENLDTLTLSSSELQLDHEGQKANLGFTGTFSAEDFFLNATITDTKVAALDLYWPPRFSKKLRHWLTNNITAGVIKKADITINAPLETLRHTKLRNIAAKAGFKKAKAMVPLEKKHLDMTIDVEDATLHFMKDTAPLKQLGARVTVSGQDVTIKGSTARFGSIELSNITAALPNFWHLPLHFDMAATVKGDVKDILPLVTKNFPKKRHETLTSITAATGAIDGYFTLAMPLKKKINFQDMRLDVEAKLSDVILPSFYKKNQLQGKALDLTLKNAVLALQGETIFGKTPVTLKNFTYFLPPKKAKINYSLSAILSAKELADYNVVSLPFLSGKTRADIDIEHVGKRMNIQGNLNLSQSKIDFPEFGFIKPVALKSMFHFNAYQEGGGIFTIEDFTLTGDSATAKGSLKINTRDQSLSHASLRNIHYGSNHIRSFSLEPKSNGRAITINAPSLDFNSLDFAKLHDKKKGAKPFYLEAKIDQLYLKNASQLQDFTLSLACPSYCKRGNGYGKLGANNFFTLDLKPMGDRTSLTLESNHAESVIRGLGITNNIKKGHLYLQASMAPKEGSYFATGNLTLRDFVTVKTPLLGKLLTLASFEGMSDALNSEGISFKKFSAPFTFQNNIITIKDAKSHGSSIGLTSNGTINLKKRQLDLKGVLIPATGINKAIRNVPVIGDIISGAKTQAFIATSYQLEGNFDDAKAKVNPLSVLAPGFLKELFD